MNLGFAAWLLGENASGHAIAGPEGAVGFPEVEPLVRSLQSSLSAAGVAHRECVALLDFDFSYWPLVALALMDGDRVYYPAPRHGHFAVDARQLAHVAPSYFLSRADRPLHAEQEVVGSVRLEAPGCAPLELVVGRSTSAQRERIEQPDVAYLVATSGSTGTPKVIMGSLRGLRHFIDWQSSLFAEPRGLRFSQLTNPTFDPVYREVFVSLKSGCVQLHRSGAGDVASAEELVAWLAGQRVSVLHCVPTLLRALCRQCAATGVGLPELRWVFCAGDHLRGVDVQAFRAHVSDAARLFNLYGPSETTLAKFAHEVQPGAAIGSVVPVGRPIPGAGAILLDASGEVCATGEAGEVYIRTEFASHGYLRDPTLTEQRFVRNPFAPTSPVPLFRTGDMARTRADGNFELLGRMDSQAKIHGRWVDLAEVEALVARVLSPHACCVIALQNERSGAAELVCFHSAPGVPSAGLQRDALLDVLPPHALPSRWVFLDELPTNANGKYARGQLAELARTLDGGEERRSRAPVSELERLLLGIWHQALPDGSRVAVDVDFTAAGGHSMDGVRIVAAIRSQLGVEVSLRSLMRAGTIERLVPHVLAAAALQAEPAARAEPDATAQREAALREGFARRLHDDPTAADRLWSELGGRSAAPEPPMRADRRRNAAPLSDAQRRFLALERLRPGNRSLNHCAAAWIPGAPDRAALGAAFDAVVARHAALRTSIRDDQQHIGERVSFPLRYVEEHGAARDAIIARASADAAVPFDLARAPLLRAVVYTAGDEFLLALSGHVIVSDGISKEVWLRDLSNAYVAASRGQPIELGQEELSFADFASHCLDSGRGKASADHWRAALRDAPWRPRLPYDRAPSGAVNERGDSVHLELCTSARAALEGVSERLRVSRSIVLLAHLLEALAAWSGQRRLLIKTPHVNRPSEALQKVTGCFTDSVVLVFDVRSARTFDQLCGYVADVLYTGMDHADASFEQICDAAGIDAARYDPSVAPIMYAPQPDYGSQLDLGQAGAQRAVLEQRTSIFNIHVFVTERAGGVALELNYSAAVFERGTIERLARTLSESLAARPGQPAANALHP